MQQETIDITLRGVLNPRLKYIEYVGIMEDVVNRHPMSTSAPIEEKLKVASARLNEMRDKDALSHEFAYGLIKALSSTTEEGLADFGIF